MSDRPSYGEQEDPEEIKRQLEQLRSRSMERASKLERPFTPPMLDEAVMDVIPGDLGQPEETPEDIRRHLDDLKRKSQGAGAGMPEDKGGVSPEGGSEAPPDDPGPPPAVPATDGGSGPPDDPGKRPTSRVVEGDGSPPEHTPPPDGPPTWPPDWLRRPIHEEAVAHLDRISGVALADLTGEARAAREAEATALAASVVAELRTSRDQIVGSLRGLIADVPDEKVRQALAAQLERVQTLDLSDQARDLLINGSVRRVVTMDDVSHTSDEGSQASYKDLTLVTMLNGQRPGVDRTSEGQEVYGQLTDAEFGVIREAALERQGSEQENTPIILTGGGSETSEGLLNRMDPRRRAELLLHYIFRGMKPGSGMINPPGHSLADLDIADISNLSDEEQQRLALALGVTLDVNTGRGYTVERNPDAESFEGGSGSIEFHADGSVVRRKAAWQQSATTDLVLPDLSDAKALQKARADVQYYYATLLKREEELDRSDRSDPPRQQDDELRKARQTLAQVIDEL